MVNWKDLDYIAESDRKKEGGQLNKSVDYDTYVEHVLNRDKMRDWDSSERACRLFDWMKKKFKFDYNNKTILDVGTKDGVLVEYLTNKYKMDALGLEISTRYVEYAKKMGRNVICGDINEIGKKDEYDFVMASKVLGLTKSWKCSFCNMVDLTKKDGYIISLDGYLPKEHRSVKKHYSLVESPEIVKGWLKNNEFGDVEVIYYDGISLEGHADDEKLLIVRKNNINRW